MKKVILYVFVLLMLPIPVSSSTTDLNPKDSYRHQSLMEGLSKSFAACNLETSENPKLYKYRDMVCKNWAPTRKLKGFQICSKDMQLDANCAQVVIVASELGTSSSKEEACHIPEVSPNFRRYISNVNKICERNRECYFPLKKEVTIRFFLMEDGVVRDPQIVKSSGIRAHDLSCIDAVLCASPLPPPPHKKLPPPPDPNLGVKESIWLDSLPDGPIAITFKPDENKSKFRLKEWKDSQSLCLPLIPIEVNYRYPNTFSKEELFSKNNFKKLVLGPNIESSIINFRYPWTDYYQSNKSGNRKSILLRLFAIQKYSSLFSISSDWRKHFREDK